jgi:amino acid adenylation domain-containing protein/non-ribosomal peptide synthase protein (TIGR01720 family)
MVTRMSETQDLARPALVESDELTTAAAEQPVTTSAPAQGLTRFQVLIWIGQKLHPDAPVYTNAGYGVVSRSIDRAHYNSAVQALIKNCDALRTLIMEEDGVPKQKVVQAIEFEPEYVDFSAASSPAAAAEEWVRNRCRGVLDFEKRPFDFALLKLGDGQYGMYSNFHHIVTDATSISIIEEVLSRYYELSVEGQLNEEPQRPRFQDYVRDLLESPTPALKSATPRKQKVHDEPERLKFYGRPAAANTTPVRRVTYVLGLERTRALKKIANDQELFLMTEDLSLHHILTALVCVFLHHISDGSRIIPIGLPFHNRKHRRDTIGCLMDVLPVKLTIGDGETFQSLIKKVWVKYLSTLRLNEYHHGNSAQRESYDVQFNYINSTPPAQLFGAPRDGKWLDTGHGFLALSIHMHPDTTGSNLVAEFDFHCDTFDEQQQELAVNHFLRVVDSFLEDSTQQVMKISLLTEQERLRILNEFNGTDAELHPAKTYIELFEAQVRKTPDRIAITHGDEGLTYEGLSTRLNLVSSRLRNLGVLPESLTAVLCNRGIDFLAVILGIFKCGGAYIPLDPEHPAQRNVSILSRSKSQVCIVAREFLPALSQALSEAQMEEPPLLVMMEDLFQPGESAKPFLYPYHAHSLSYVIYTSGSTGEPKGAMVELAGMLNHLFIKIRDFHLSETDVVAQSASQCFDVSVWQFLSILLVGGRVCMIDNATLRDPISQFKLMERENVSVLEVVPSELRAMLDSIDLPGAELPAMRSLRCVFVMGEVLDPLLCDRWFDCFGHVALINGYGATECSDDVNHYWMRSRPDFGNRSVPLAGPLMNLRIFVQNAALEMCPIGVAGSIYIAGVGVGRGYLNDPVRTAQSFIPDGYTKIPGGRAYHTGDLGRYLPDGNLEFIGRSDHQVKIRGFRIELGEVESTIARISGVAQAAVTTRNDEELGHRLVAYFVTEQGLSLTASQLRNFVKSVLPPYMVPSAFVRLESMPLNENGKLNRKALPPPDSVPPDPEELLAEPSSKLEAILLAIWAQVLGLELIGVNDNFFDLGGDSILAIHVAAKVSRVGPQLSSTDVFTHPTISELAALLSSNLAAVAEQEGLNGSIPLTPIQHRFAEQEKPDPNHSSQTLVLQTHADLDPALFERAVIYVREHHDALRVLFAQEETTWRQYEVAIPGRTLFTYEDVSALSRAEQQALIDLRAEQFASSLNLWDGPLVRVVLFKLGNEKGSVVLWTIHRLLVDDASWRILLEDLQRAYARLSEGEQNILFDGSRPFRQWSKALTEYARSPELTKEVNFWTAMSNAAIGRLPLDHPAGVNSKESRSVASARISSEETAVFLNVARESYGMSAEEILIGAVVLALAEWSGESSFLLEIERNMRKYPLRDIDVSRTVGWFAAAFPVVVNISGTSGPIDILKKLKDQLRRIPTGGLGYSVLRYLSSDAAIGTRLSSIAPQVHFSFRDPASQIAPASEHTLYNAATLSATEPGHDGKLASLLEVDAVVREGQLCMSWTYSGNIYLPATIERLAENCMAQLKSLITRADALREKGHSPSNLIDFNWSEEDLDDISAVLDR